ncbi:hypothetical protein [Streptomyces sp. WAC 06738]|uniref:hypothetical protein n=1 Tax=Streptomyces sp. WAC 06738 TaxID=2203210 RepID=UPI0013E07FCF|nr:hypothetical protein [Streptomyces sp. WAC 06738]
MTGIETVPVLPYSVRVRCREGVGQAESRHHLVEHDAVRLVRNHVADADGHDIGLVEEPLDELRPVPLDEAAHFAAARDGVVQAALVCPTDHGEAAAARRDGVEVGELPGGV